MVNEKVKRRHQPYYKFRTLLKEKGIKQEEVAKLLGKTVSALNQNINGTGGDFSVSEVRLICITYNISADEFFINNLVSN